MIEYIWRVNGLDVFYTNETNGGGDYFALEYIDAVKEFYGSVEHILEWCSGPGFIGYGMYASKICKKISFIDKYKPAVEQLYKTKNNDNNISIYHSDSVGIIPQSVKFDIIVGNPPHWENKKDAQKVIPHDNFNDHVEDILIDPNWQAHTDFFMNAKFNLADDGIIFLQENSTGSSPEIFKPLVEQAGLKISTHAQSKMYKDIYYLEIKHAR